MSPPAPAPHPFAALDPSSVIAAVESLGFACDGRVLPLNSYENRVYQIGIEGAAPVVAKFYRPGRWSDAAILEEHGFAAELAAREIPVVAPLVLDERTLHAHAGFRFTVYPRRGGRRPDLERPADLAWVGRLLARIHAVGRTRHFAHRLTLDPETYGRAAQRFLIDHRFIPDHLRAAYSSLTAELLTAVEERLRAAAPIAWLRIHGDCHPGNLLWSEDGPHFVDLDDCCRGPAIQDLWMLLAGDRDEQSAQLAAVLEGYGQFAELDPTELGLIEPLRTLRIMHYSAWLARRWDDPAFPQAFPWFNTTRYWEDHVLALREQAAALQEPPLCP